MAIERRQVEELLVRVCGSKQVLQPGLNLVESGLLDSLALIDFFDELNLLGVELQPTQVVNDDLRSVDLICALLRIK